MKFKYKYLTFLFLLINLHLIYILLSYNHIVLTFYITLNLLLRLDMFKLHINKIHHWFFIKIIIIMLI